MQKRKIIFLPKKTAEENFIDSTKDPLRVIFFASPSVQMCHQFRFVEQRECHRSKLIKVKNSRT